ncbi:peptidoglycan-binding protein [Amylibacter sp.]|nr:peptidoglycan-binding protein [Amylibacter sp.]
MKISPFKVYLTIGILLVGIKPSIAAECTDDPNECTLKELCEISTALDGRSTVWSNAAKDTQHVALAQNLAMDCGVTPIINLCDIDPNECKVSEICQKATTTNGGKRYWDTTAEAYVSVAKKFGLQCGIIADFDTSLNANKIKVSPEALNFKVNFLSKPMLQRKQAQYALKSLGFYNSSIDGLWGPKTNTALNKFIQSNDLSGKSYNQIFKKLISRVNLPTSFKQSEPIIRNNFYNREPDYTCNIFKINFQGMGFKFATNNGMTSATISGPTGTEKLNKFETKKILEELNTSGSDVSILLWFKGNKVTLGFPNMEDTIAKAIKNVPPKDRPQLKKITQKVFQPVIFQKTNNVISWSQFIPNELKREIGLNSFSMRYTFRSNTKEFLVTTKLNLNGQKVDARIKYKCRD